MIARRLDEVLPLANALGLARHNRFKVVGKAKMRSKLRKVMQEASATT